MRCLAAVFLLIASIAPAQESADAHRLFDEGQANLRSGNAGKAKVAFATLLAVYPESSLAASAKEGIARAEKQEPELPVIAAIRFEKFRSVRPEEILRRLREREVGMEVLGAFDPRDLADAARTVREYLAEHGHARWNIRAEARPVTPHRVAVVFTLEHRGLLPRLL